MTQEIRCLQICREPSDLPDLISATAETGLVWMECKLVCCPKEGKLSKVPADCDVSCRTHKFNILLKRY